MRLFEGEWDLPPVLDLLGQVWRITEVSHKPWVYYGASVWRHLG